MGCVADQDLTLAHTTPGCVYDTALGVCVSQQSVLVWANPARKCGDSSLNLTHCRRSDGLGRRPAAMTTVFTKITVM